MRTAPPQLKRGTNAPSCTCTNGTHAPKKSRAAKRSSKQRSSDTGHPARQVHTLVAMANPFHKALVEPTGSMILPKPSQKISVVAAVSVTMAAGHRGIFVVTPSIANDRVSCWGYTGTAGDLGTGTLATPGAGLSFVQLSTPSPYSVSTLAGRDYQYRCVTNGVKIRYQGTELNRGGRVYILTDTEFSMWRTGETPSGTVPGWASTTIIGAIGNSCVTAPHVRKMNFSQATEFIAGNHSAFFDNGTWVSIPTSAATDSYSNFYEITALPNVNGITTSGTIVVPGSCVFVVDNPATAQSAFEIEVLENWEIRSQRDIPYLHTTQAAHPVAHQVMSALKQAAIGQHHTQPTVQLGKVIKQVASSPEFKSVLKDTPIVTAALALL